MRLFRDLTEAIPEIRRDLSKAPKVESSRVQNIETVGHSAYEAQNYSYSVLPGGVPEIQDLLILLKNTMPAMAELMPQLDWMMWLEAQLCERIYDRGLYNTVFDPADRNHPVLNELREGEHWSYTYGERLYGSVHQAANILLLNPDSRRCFIPIYQPMDFLRAHAMTRIPCSIGYQLSIRNVGGAGSALHMTYLSRSCDFEKFWLSDIWLASQFQFAVLKELLNRWAGSAPMAHPMPELGVLTHHILSFHRFPEDAEELF